MPSGVTAGVLVKSAMRLGGAIATGETPTPDELTDGLAAFNDLLENWSTQNLAVFGNAVESFPTVVGQAVYTIGPGGNWNTVRPIRINDNSYCTFQGVDFPVGRIGQDEYNLIALKTQQQPIIEKLLYVNENPLGKITLWPVPAQIVTISLDSDRVLTSVADTATVISMPPGYLLAMKHALWILMAPDYGRTIPDAVLNVAQSSFAAIKRANKVKRVARFDAALVGDDPVTWQSGT